MKTIESLFGSFIGFFVLILIIASAADSKEYDEQAQKKCTKEVASSIGTSTYIYTDKQAYEAYVKRICILKYGNP